MTKHSRHEREARTAETERMKQVESAWYASIPADVATAFSADVAAVHARGPRQAPPDQPPGTQPNPPRPGHEPKPPKAEPRSRGGRR